MIIIVIALLTISQLVFAGQYASTVSDASFQQGYFTDVITASDGSYIACGPISLMGGSSPQHALVWMDTAYQVTKVQTFNAIPVGTCDVCRLGKSTTGDIYIAGTGIDGSASYVSMFTKTDPLGTLIWNGQKSCSPGSNRIFSINVRSDEVIFAAGAYSNGGMFPATNYDRWN